MSAVNLSGGYRIRLSLAKALYLNPPLLLDEPSNHLDLNASIWLIDYLSRLKSTIVVVSHSIALIDDVCDTIILLDEKKLTYYRGNYTSYKTMRDQRAAKSVKARERLPKIAFENFDDIPMGPLISMHNVSFAYLSTNPIFTNVNFGLYKETKMALVGPNGAGKTTFLKLLNETVTPTAGYVSFNRLARLISILSIISIYPCRRLNG
jgi:ATPase subunit of ABC transporter with duplicated ATPase domains